MNRKGREGFASILVVLISLVLVVWGFLYIYGFFVDSELGISDSSFHNFINLNVPDVDLLVSQGQLIVSDCCSIDTYISYENFVEEEDKRDVMSGYYYDGCNDCSSPKVFVTYNKKGGDIPEEEVINNIYLAPSCNSGEPVIVERIVPEVIVLNSVDSIFVAPPCGC